AALIGVIAEASRTAPTSAARSRRFHGARLRYSRSVCSGSACGAPVTPRLLPSRLGSSLRALLTDLEYRGQPIRHFAQIERFPNHDALVPLEPDAHLVCLGVTRHDRDTAFICRPTMHDSEIEGDARHRRQVD